MESTRVRALREAQSLLQMHGFNGFSFQHIADRLGIKAPSLYTHFASKEDLGAALINEYDALFATWTSVLASSSPEEKIKGLFEMYFKFSTDSCKYCPLTSFSADLQSLPKSLQKLARAFFERQRAWVESVVADGQKKKVFRRDLKTDALTQVVLSFGFGAQTVGRLTQAPDEIREIRASVLKLLKG